MGETRRLADQLKRAVAGVAWHGPSLLELLRDVPLEHVAARPVAGAHTIAEIARHALAWQDIVTRRLAGEVWRDETPDEDWPVTSGSAEWQGLLERLERGALKLAADIEAFPDERLNKIIPRRRAQLLRHAARPGATPPLPRGPDRPLEARAQDGPALTIG